MKKMQRSVRFTILSLLISLVLSTSLIIILVSYWGSRSSATTLVENLMTNISEHMMDNALHYLNAADTASSLSKKLAKSKILSTENNAELTSYFSDLLKSHKQFIMLNYGDLNGNFLMVKKMADESFSVKTIQRNSPNIKTKVAKTKWVHENSKWRKTYKNVVEPLDKAYDPRKRPWYQGAKNSGEIIWTDVYVFFSDKMPGISCATAVYDNKKNLKGVISIDIGLSELSQFIGSLKIGENGKAFILNQKNEIIAMPMKGKSGFNLVKEVRGPDATQFKLYNIEEIADDVISASYRSYLNKYNENKSNRIFFNFSYKSEGYMSMYSDFRKERGRHWKVGIIIPERDFMQKVYRNNVITMVVSFVIVIIAIAFGVLFSKTISQPLSRLSSEMDKIQQLRLEDDVIIRSNLVEVVNMLESFHKMKKGLKSFEKYAPSELVKQLIRLGKVAKLGGERKILTVYFSDIVGFTTLSEKRSPEKIVEQLAEYFGEMSSVIKQNRGTVDKYIGDAVMAFWGAPISQKDHALSACTAALQAQAKLQELQEKWKKEKKPILKARIGVNTGDLVVGNLGSETRLNYTVIGDSVNLASRLEGLNKVYGTKIIIGEKTYRMVKSKVIVRFLDKVAVKGKTKPVAVYELIALK